MIDLNEKICTKCLMLYERKKTFKPVLRFLARLNLESALENDVWFNRILPKIRRRHFPNLTVDALLKDSLELYRSSSSPLSALIDIWDRLDTQLPLSIKEYLEFVERFCALLEKEDNPPSKKDWDSLDEWLMK